MSHGHRRKGLHGQAANRRDDPYGASPRFGSAYLRLRPKAVECATFCWPDSFYDPQAVGGPNRLEELCALADAGVLDASLLPERAADVPLDDPLNDYVEAHVHGGLLIGHDMEALVLDRPWAARSRPPAWPQHPARPTLKPSNGCGTAWPGSADSRRSHHDQLSLRSCRSRCAPAAVRKSKDTPVADGEDGGMTMHTDQLHVDAQTVRRLVEVQFPQWRGLPVAELRTPGTVNAIFRIGDDLAARFPLIGHDSVQARASLEAEAEAARQLADAASVPTPVPVAIGKDKLRTGRPGRVAVNRSCG